MTVNSRWLSGPDFLSLPEDSWPPNEFCDQEENLEIVVPKINLYQSEVSTSKQFIDWNQFSSRFKYLRVYAYVLGFKTKLLLRHNNKEFPDYLKQDWLSPKELQEAKMLLCNYAQKDSYKQELTSLTNAQPVHNKSQLLQLVPILEDGILRVGGRIGNAPISHTARHQIILHNLHPISRLILRHLHILHGHAGREQLLAISRQEFWIPQAKSLVRKITHDCLHCKRETAKPAIPVMAPLPKSRLAMYEQPFTNTGIDYFGPLFVKQGRSTAKRWGVVFTCLTTRAVHLELASDMSKDAFILVLRRFCARRGNVKLIISDNGTNFVGAERELLKSLKDLEHQSIAVELAKHQTEWSFHPPASPHFGEVFEIMVRLTKRTMRAITRSHVFKEETLITILAEVESILNSRPLTSNSDDPDNFEALTPNHFLLGRTSTNYPPGHFITKETKTLASSPILH